MEHDADSKKCMKNRNVNLSQKLLTKHFLTIAYLFSILSGFICLFVSHNLPPLVPLLDCSFGDAIATGIHCFVSSQNVLGHFHELNCHSLLGILVLHESILGH